LSDFNNADILAVRVDRMSLRWLKFWRISGPTPELRRHLQGGFAHPAALYLDIICASIGRSLVTNALEGDLVPVSGEAQITQRLRISAKSNLVQLDERNGRLEMLIAELVVEWTRNARLADVIDECAYAKHAGKNHRADDNNDDLRGATPFATRRGRKRRRLFHLEVMTAGVESWPGALSGIWNDVPKQS
jgi:hypothetical protein